VPCNLWRDVAHGGEHANATVLDLHGTTALEGVGVSIFSQAERIEETKRCLCSKLVFERAKWRVCEERPVSPC